MLTFFITGAKYYGWGTEPDWIKLASAVVEAPPASSSVSSSSTDAIAYGLHLGLNASDVHCQIFDMNGNMVKSAKVPAGSARDLWNSANANLPAGLYIMRFGQGKSMQTVRVRK